MSRFIITGTDTDVGKTIVSAMLVASLGASYWKPIQAGSDPETDAQRVAKLASVSADKILPEAYRLTLPASPHFAAEQDGVAINLESLDVPEVSGPLIVEGAGGLLVPLTRSTLQIEIFAGWDLPVIVCARTSLGTINHTLMSLATLHDWEIPIHGLIFVGDEHADNQRTIVEMGGVRALGRMPHLASITPDTLRAAFVENFKAEDFA